MVHWSLEDSVLDFSFNIDKGINRWCATDACEPFHPPVILFFLVCNAVSQPVGRLCATTAEIILHTQASTSDPGFTLMAAVAVLD